MRFATLIACMLLLCSAQFACGEEKEARPTQAPVATLDLSVAPGCYETASLDANVTAVELSSDPVGLCEEAWRDGAVKSGVSEAPELTVCIGDVGQAPLVFPGDSSVCERLGLRIPE